MPSNQTFQVPLSANTDFSSRKFGVEIEAYGVNKYDIESTMNRANIPCTVEPYNHVTKPYWKIVTDGSINTRGVGNAFELVSPPLEGQEGIKQIVRVLDILKDLGAQVNNSCGIHVHVDTRDIMSLNFIRFTHLRYAMWENFLDLYFQTNRRKDSNRFCRSLNNGNSTRYPYGRYTPELSHDDWLNHLGDKFFETYYISRDFYSMSIQDKLNIFERFTIERYNETRNRYNDKNSKFFTMFCTRNFSDRYKKLNFSSFSHHGTIEFRQLEGTLDSKKVEAWINFCVQFTLTSYKLSNVYLEEANGHIFDSPSRHSKFLNEILDDPFFHLDRDSIAHITSTIFSRRTRDKKELVKNFNNLVEAYKNIHQFDIKSAIQTFNTANPSINDLIPQL